MAEDRVSIVAPRVGIVVVNYFGGDRTLGCLGSLRLLTWPAEQLRIVLVDNGSEPGFRSVVQGEFPEVLVVDAGANLGFGGACNLAFARLGDCEFVALVNNDATPEPGWLEPLVETLERHPRAGAATPKVLLEGAFVAVELSSPALRPRRGDSRALGVQLCGVRIGGTDLSERMHLAEGFWGWEHDGITVGGPFAWTSGEALALVSTESVEPMATVEIRLACGAGPKRAIVRCGRESSEVEVGIHPSWSAVGTVAQSYAVVNNAGTELRPDGSAADRGYLLPDDGRFDEPGEVFGWSGAAVLLRRAYLDDVGGFAAPFFLYYEDTDLSWRGQLRGWSYRYVPSSRVRHEHSATIGERSPLARHLSERNRLTMLTRVAPRAMAKAAIVDLIARLARAVGHDVFGQLLRGRRPAPGHAAALGRILIAYLRSAPTAVRDRKRIRSTARVPDAAILSHAGGLAC